MIAKNLKAEIRSALYPVPAAETRAVAATIAAARRLRPQYPYCPSYEGDLLYRLAARPEISRAIEIGFATGSTALYLLEAIASKGGAVFSIDYKQDDFDNLGIETVAASPRRDAHTLLEGNSNLLLPRLLDQGERFDLVFLDGWKVFDHLLVDVYYTARMLREGGYMFFDDANMPSTRKVISLLSRYYQFEEIDYSAFGEGWRHLAWFALSQGGLRWGRPYRAFRKPRDFDKLPAISRYDFWSSF